METTDDSRPSGVSRCFGPSGYGGLSSPSVLREFQIIHPQLLVADLRAVDEHGTDQ